MHLLQLTNQMATGANARLLRPWLKGAQNCHLSASGTYASMLAWNRLSPALPPATYSRPWRQAIPQDDRGTDMGASSAHRPSLGSSASTDLSLCRSFVMPPAANTRPAHNVGSAAAQHIPLIGWCWRPWHTAMSTETTYSVGFLDPLYASQD